LSKTPTQQKRLAGLGWVLVGLGMALGGVVVWGKGAHYLSGLPGNEILH